MILNKKNLTYGVEPGYDKKTIVVGSNTTLKLSDYYTGKDLLLNIKVATGATATIVDDTDSTHGFWLKIANIGGTGYTGNVVFGNTTISSTQWAIFLKRFDGYQAIDTNIQ